MSVPFNEGQLKALEELSAFENSDQWEIVLEGPPGSGKTTILQEYVVNSRLNVLFTAPTNKATRVLRQMAEKRNIPVDCCTTYSALGLTMSTEDEIKEVFQYNKEEVLEGVDVLVVDECSMVGKNLRQYIYTECKSRGVKVIYVGDRYQIPPVGEEISETFMVPNQLKLDKIERVIEGNPILQVVNNIRECIDVRRYPQFQTAANDGVGVYTVDKPTFGKFMRQGFASSTYKNVDDSFKCVAWRNATVSDTNLDIRKALFGSGASQQFVLGERVVAAAPVIPSDPLSMADRMSTDDEGTIESLSIGPHPDHPGDPFTCWHLTISSFGSYVKAYVIMEEEKYKLEEKLQRMAAMCKAKKLSWKAFWEYKDSFHDIRPCHAITAHRSQGSTYENTFVDVNDILANRNTYEALRILYVACSRSSKRLILRVAS